ncbi:hypothetical protein AMAG_05462 [Allomyces macrogynus ATCC 38327]|uniref:Uncharacterized protein n=1 Tax=Allomyces macrogynus (strain ATCC 38327) TaxID=578462 RepID=A0A0L0SC61_ALLM3|nr:hypothetical protein AMAG_05462 [Allomyces macrogynus ATCC 38327]|eukprot:KNE60022.1 hypothetical protein AMAG_05462 [Allomyces macrogynus ATCC 38327]
MVMSTARVQKLLDPKTMKVVDGNVQVQTRQALNNLKVVLKAAGSDLEHVVKTLVFLKDMSSFMAMNQVSGLSWWPL